MNNSDKNRHIIIIIKSERKKNIKVFKTLDTKQKMVGQNMNNNYKKPRIKL